MTLGPYASFSFSRFDWGQNMIAGEAVESNLAPPDDEDRRAWHEWFVVGVRLGVALVR